MFNEGQETASEQMLRERKHSLLSLFDVLDLKPRRGSSFTRKPHGELDGKDLEVLTQRRASTNEKKVMKKEIVGDGEEVEVEADGEDLSENELSLIYKRYRVDTWTCRTVSDLPQSAGERPEAW